MYRRSTDRETSTERQTVRYTERETNIQIERWIVRDTETGADR